MKIIALGDTHGRPDWRKVIQKEDYDKLIFVGDYFDSRENISPRLQMENFKRILMLKKNDPERVVMLIGNHDYHYFNFVDERYSGFQEHYKNEISLLLKEALRERLLQMCFLYDLFLFSHAGVTKTWLDNNIATDEPIEQGINNLLHNSPESFRFTMGENRSLFGDDITQSPIWVRPSSLLKDRVRGYIQVVGHTIQEFIVPSDDVVFIDAIGTSGEYFKYDHQNIVIGKFKS